MPEAPGNLFPVSGRHLKNLGLRKKVFRIRHMFLHVTVHILKTEKDDRAPAGGGWIPCIVQHHRRDKDKVTRMKIMNIILNQETAFPVFHKIQFIAAVTVIAGH